MLVYQRVTPKKTSANHIKQPLHIHADPTVIYTVYSLIVAPNVFPLASKKQFKACHFGDALKPHIPRLEVGPKKIRNCTSYLYINIISWDIR